ncbi:MAG: aldo/keto reductase [Tomitella sp.]|nr:aldo/keto reductase [Tomitella sp.]
MESTSNADMPYRRFGRSGLAASVIGLGCNNLGKPGTASETFGGATALIDAAIDAGITLFDTSDTYGATPGLSEELLGQALGRRRADVVVATKFGMNMRGANGDDFAARGSRRYLVRAVDESLRRLGTEWIDLYQFHTPDPLTPIDETLSAMDDLVRSGKIRYAGHANRAGWQIAEAEYVARAGGGTRFVSAQNQYNLLAREAEQEVLPAVRAYDMGFLPFFPLANGLLTGKYTRSGGPADGRITRSKPHLLESAPWDRLERFTAFAAERGISELTASLGWLAAQDGVTSVIAGATRPEQVEQNAAAAAWVPDAADLEEIDMIFPPAAPVSPF